MNYSKVQISFTDETDFGEKFILHFSVRNYRNMLRSTEKCSSVLLLEIAFMDKQSAHFGVIYGALFLGQRDS